MGDLPREVLVLLPVFDPKFGASQAPPGRGFGLAVALEEVSQALGSSFDGLPGQDQDFPRQVLDKRRR